MDFPLYFQILLGQWEGVILEILYGLFRDFSSLFLRKNTAWFVKLSNFDVDPLICHRISPISLYVNKLHIKVII